jgi:hypothetical protein
MSEILLSFNIDENNKVAGYHFKKWFSALDPNTRSLKILINHYGFEIHSGLSSLGSS